MNDNIVYLNKYKFERKEQRKKEEQSRKVSTLKAFKPGHYYIYPEMGLMVHVLFLTDKSIKFNKQAVYVMEDQFGNFFADVVEEDTCNGWHELAEEVFLHAIEQNSPPEPPEPIAG